MSAINAAVLPEPMPGAQRNDLSPPLRIQAVGSMTHSFMRVIRDPYLRKGADRINRECRKATAATAIRPKTCSIGMWPMVLMTPGTLGITLFSAV